MLGVKSMIRTDSEIKASRRRFSPCPSEWRIFYWKIRYSDYLRNPRYCLCRETRRLKFTGADEKKYYHDVLTNFAMLESRDCKQYYEYLKPEDSWKKIGLARYQWNIFYFDSQNYYDFRYGFKHRLLRFRCLPLSDNLRQRKKINSFLKLLSLKWKNVFTKTISILCSSTLNRARIEYVRALLLR